MTVFFDFQEQLEECIMEGCQLMTAESGDKNFSKLGDETLIGRRKVEKKAV